MKNFTIIALIIIISFSALSEFADRFKFEGVVQSFDQNQVQVLCNGRKVSIPRSIFKGKNLKPGKSIPFDLTGAQMKKAFFEKPQAPGFSTSPAQNP